MSKAILPSSAAPFAPRTYPIVVLDHKIPQWLTATLKRVSPAGRSLKNLKQHTEGLAKILSSESAIWALCSVMLKSPLGMIHIEAYVVHVDMVFRNEVSFKLTEETLDALESFHNEFQLAATASYAWDWPGKEAQMKDLQKDFVQAVNMFVYRTNAEALDELEDDGSGELLCGSSEDAKAAISRLFVPMMPPPHVVHFLCPVVPYLDGTKPSAHRPIHLFEKDMLRSTQSGIRTSNAKNHHNTGLGDGLDIIDAAFSPIDLVGGPLFTGEPVPDIHPISHMPMYRSITAANVELFGGSPSSFR